MIDRWVNGYMNEYANGQILSEALMIIVVDAL